MEHEIIHTSSDEEMRKLVESNCPLNVLVTYFSADHKSQYDWLNNKFAETLKTLQRDPHSDSEYLIILPGNAEKELAHRWRFYQWHREEERFEKLAR